MAEKDTAGGMQSEKRHVYGSRPIGALMPRVTRPAFRRRSPATAQVLADWSVIVGPAIAAVTTPRRLTGGTLTIACAGPIAMELQHLATEVIARINAHLGRQAVSSLRFTQTLEPGRSPVPLPAPPDPARLVALETTLGGLPEGDLRSALTALGHAVLQFPNRSRSP